MMPFSPFATVTAHEPVSSAYTAFSVSVPLSAMDTIVTGLPGLGVPFCVDLPYIVMPRMGVVFSGPVIVTVEFGPTFKTFVCIMPSPRQSASVAERIIVVSSTAIVAWRKEPLSF